MSFRRLKAEEVKRVKSLIVDTDLTDTEIAQRFGVDRSAIGKIRQGRSHRDVYYPGFTPGMRNRKRPDLKLHLKEIVDLRNEEWSYRAIGDKFGGYSASTIVSYYKKGLEKYGT